MEILNLTLTQRVALWWLKYVDGDSLILFEFLKDLSFPFRALLYMGLIAFTIFGLIFASSFINFAGAPIWQLIGDVIYYGVIAGTTLITTLESVYKLDGAQVLADIKLQKQEIKAQKLQRWRLRNMNIFMRIFIYISLYMFLLSIIQYSAQGAFTDLFSAAPKTAETQRQIAFFMNEYDTFVKFFTFLYLTSGLTLDYFVIKNRVKRRMEAQNESV